MGRDIGERGKGYQSYLFVSVKRVDDELHHSVDLGLEGKLLCLFPQLFHLGHTQPVQLDGLLLSGMRNGELRILLLNYMMEGGVATDYTRPCVRWRYKSKAALCYCTTEEVTLF